MNTTPRPENPYASPQSEEAPVVSNPTPAWRDGELVVVAPEGELPQTCVICGRDAADGTRHRMYLHSHFLGVPKLIAFLIVFGLTMAGLFFGAFFIPKLFAVFGFRAISSNAEVAIVSAVNLTVSLLLLTMRWNQRATTLKYWRCRRHTWTRLLYAVGMLLLVAYCAYSFAFFRFFGIRVLAIQSPIFVLVFCLGDASRVTRREAGLVWIKGFKRAFWSTLPPLLHGAEHSSPAIDL